MESAGHFYLKFVANMELCGLAMLFTMQKWVVSIFIMIDCDFVFLMVSDLAKTGQNPTGSDGPAYGHTPEA